MSDTTQPTMRAKFVLQSVTPSEGGEGEELFFNAVTEAPFDADGNSEDNSFSKWTPAGTLVMTVTNPALCGKLKPGEKFYLDFTKAE